MMTRGFQLASWIVLALCGSSASSPSENFQKPMVKSDFCKSIKSYTALGDSYAAGLGALKELRTCRSDEKSTTANCTTEGCHKDTGSYGYLFAQEFAIPSFQYLACTGSSSNQVLDGQVNSNDGTDFGTGDATPDLVTLVAGGDDGDFFRETAQKCVFYRTSHDECMAALGHAEGEIKTLPERMSSLTDAIKARIKPSTKVVVLSYARFFNLSNSKCGFWFDGRLTAEEKAEINRLVQNLNRQLENVTRKAGFIWASVDDAYEGHRFCDSPSPTKDTWFQIVIRSPPSPLHPTYDGQVGYLNALKRALNCS